MKASIEFKVAAIITAATIGDGIFALPYVFKEAGWLVGIFYIAILAAIVIGAHVVYLATLEKNHERKRLLGLAREHFGAPGFWIGFFAVVVGLLLVLVAYLILGTAFVRLAAPGLSSSAALVFFWAAVYIPVFMSDGRVAMLEMFGVACIAAVVLFIFGSAFPNVTFAGIAASVPGREFLPFGAILFALAGWTGIEPALELSKRRGANGVNGSGGVVPRRNPWRGVALGTVLAAALILMFVSGILGSASQVTVEAVSGLFGWPLWKREVVALLGLFAVWTAFMPISHEIKNSLEKDLRWPRLVARALVVLAPITFVALGINNFFAVVSFVGGVFLSAQYLLIVAVGRRALAPSPGLRVLLDVITAVFLLGFVYELWIFIVH